MALQIGKRTGKRTRVLIGVGAALLALVVLATTAFAAGPGGRIGNRGGNGAGNFGPEAVITAVDTSAQIITLAGVPQQIATVKVDANVKLTATQPDGTKKDAAIGDFKAGSLVRVELNVQRGNKQGGQGTTGQMPTATVKGITLLPAGQARVEGLVTATSGGTLTISGMGGLQLTVNTSGAKVTKGQNNAAASAGDIKVGDRIVAGGAQSGTTINATTVRILDLSNLGHGGAKPAGTKPAGTAKP